MGLIRRVSIYSQFAEARTQGFVSIIVRKRELYILASQRQVNIDMIY